MKQYYYAEDKYGNSHEHGSDYYQYSFNRLSTNEGVVG